MEPAFFPKPVWGHNDQSDNRGESGCKYCSKHPHSTRKNENIVKHHIKEAPRDRGDHGKLRIAVISHKAENDIVEDKGWGKQHQHLQISGRHLPDFLICTEDGGNPSGKENPARHKQKGEKDTKIHGICKNLIRPFFVVLAFQNRKFCSSSHRIFFINLNYKITWEIAIYKNCSWFKIKYIVIFCVFNQAQ